MTYGQARVVGVVIASMASALTMAGILWGPMWVRYLAVGLLAVLVGWRIGNWLVKSIR